MDPRDDLPGREISQPTNPEPSSSRTKSKHSMTDKGKGKEKSRSSSSKKDSSNSGKDRLVSKMNRITNWLSTSEPSANALKQHKKETFQKAGVPLNDPEAPAKIHAPIGQIPRDAIKPAAGPDPEDVARKKAEQRRKMKKQLDQERKNSTSASASASASGTASYSGASSSLQTPSLSGYSSMSGPDSSMYVTGDDDFGANGWGPR